METIKILKYFPTQDVIFNFVLISFAREC